jgi:hypothetical protein
MIAGLFFDQINQNRRKMAISSLQWPESLGLNRSRHLQVSGQLEYQCRITEISHTVVNLPQQVTSFLQQNQEYR